MAAPLVHVVRMLEDFKECTKCVHDFVIPHLEFRDAFCKITKSLYDEEISFDHLKEDHSDLPKLITKNFDDEQIWQQLELSNSSNIPYLLGKVTKTVVKRKINISLGVLESANSTENFVEQVTDVESKNSSSDDEPSLEKVKKLKKSRSKVKVKKRDAGVEDQFFKLSQLEKFLNQEDAKFEKENRNEDSSDESSTDVDYFEDIPSDDMSDFGEKDDGQKGHKSAREAVYQNFFDPPPDENGENQGEKSNLEEDEEKKENEELSDMEYDTRDVEDDQPPTAEELWSSRKRDLLPASDSEESDNSSTENEDSVKNNSRKSGNEKSAFQKQQDKLKDKMSQLEEMNLSEKPWQLKGEISAEGRPENSLLEEHLQFDHLVRQAPVITEETTKTLEEIILQRVKDKAWDDVERKVKPKEAPFEYKRRVILDQEKSKQSLAEIYEKEYIKKQQQDNNEDKQLPEHTKIKKAMTELFFKLDSLSNFHYTPKAPSSDIKVINNLPAISVEDVAPVSVSDAGILAPEEIQEKVRGELRGQTEKSTTDRKRERRAKKLFQRKRKIGKEGSLKTSLQTKQSKEESKRKNKERKNNQSDQGTVKTKSLNSSSAFFEKLQDKVHQEINDHVKKRKKGNI